jgi:hypothetical protein
MINDTILAACIAATANQPNPDIVAWHFYDLIMDERARRNAGANDLAA